MYNDATLDDRRSLVLRAMQILRDQPPTMDVIDAMDLPKKMDETFRVAIPELRFALKDSNDDVRLFAIESLASIGGDLGTMISDIAIAASDKCEIVRGSAATLLGNASGAGVPIALATLRHIVKDRRAHIATRTAAFKSLVKLLHGVIPAVHYVVRGRSKML